MCMEATARDSRSMEVNAARLARSVAELESDHPAAASYWPCAWAPATIAPVALQRQAAEQGARTLLMPTAAWQHAAGLSNPELAEAFNVPLDQVVQRRLELASQGWWQLAPEAAR